MADSPVPPVPPDPLDPLDELLERSRRDIPPQPGSVSPEVWRRIEAAETKRPRGWLEQLHGVFARPSFSVTFVAACMLLGLFLAEVRSSRLQAERSVQLAQSYLRLIDPLLGEKDAPTRSP